MSPLASTSMAPKPWKIAPAVSTLSPVVPSPMPNGRPPLWQASAALRNASNVQASALGGAPPGDIARTAIPAAFLLRRMGAHGPLILPHHECGAPRHVPATLPS